jgi:predicted MPP superfamily phosphohydrolase
MLRPWLFEPLVVERVTVPIRDLPVNLQGITLVHLSDLHFDGQCLSLVQLEGAIAQSNAIAPDLVVLTGDFITEDVHTIHVLAQHLQRLQSRYGCYAVLGNHDSYYLSDRHTITEALERVNIPVLWNTIAYPFGAELPLVGLADLWSGECHPAQVMAAIAPHIPRLVMAHNPDTATRLAPWRVDLQLSGHTHGGQIVIPHYGPVPQLLQQLRHAVPQPMRRYVPFLRKNCDRVVQRWEWASGLHRVGQNQLYVNRGLGTYFPGRLFCPPELTLITLEAAL